MLFHCDHHPLRWLFLDLNSYFASVEQQTRPELRGRPVAVVPSMTDSTCAIAASYEAKAYGVKTGTKIWEAKRLCPGLICVPARHDIYVTYHHRIFEEVEKHLHVTRICSIDEAACALIGAECQPDNATWLARRIKQGLRENVGPAITCSIGIAPNRFLAKEASKLQKPDGLVVLKAEEVPKLLFPRKLTDLNGISSNMERRLSQGGIYTIEQFWHLSPKHARRIWGSVEGERFWYNLRGYNLPEQQTQKRVVGHSRVLDPVLRTPDKAYNVTRHLTVKAATRLRRYELYARGFSLKVSITGQESWKGKQRLPAAQDNAAFLQILEGLWARMLAETGAVNIRKVAISLFSLSKPEYTTPDLFESAGPQKKEKKENEALSTAMEKINRHYGPGTVQLGPRLQTEAGYVGTKIAFSRIPDKEEFLE